MPCRLPAPCCRPGSTTTAGGSTWRTRSSGGSRTATRVASCHRPHDEIDYLQLNQADPWRDVDGERASIKTTHPFLTDPAVRSALALLVDRTAIQGELMGRQGETTGNFLNRRLFASPNTKWKFNPDQANAVLDAAGWKRGADGIRAKDGKRLKVLSQTANVPVRQKMQQIVKQACGRAGIECELKAVVGSVFFSSDPGNVDTESHFYADMQLSTKILRQPDPQVFMRPVLLVGGRPEDEQVGGRQREPVQE